MLALTESNAAVQPTTSWQHDAGSSTHDIEATCTARPGLREDLERLIHQFPVTVGAITTRVFEAPMAGTPVFHAVIPLPGASKHIIERLQTELELLEPDLIVSSS
jgi:glycine cleavage system regulatory protein